MAAADHVLPDHTGGHDPAMRLLRQAATQTFLEPQEPAERGVQTVCRLGGTDIIVRVVTEIGPVETIWRRFQDSADMTAFQSIDWLATWQRTIGQAAGVVPAIVIGHAVTATDSRPEAGSAIDSEPLFILPLAVARRRGVRQLTFLGHELCDYNAPLLAPEFTRLCGDGFPALWRAIEALLMAGAATRHDLVMFDKMPETVGSQPNPFLAIGPALNPSGAYRTKLSGDWDHYYAEKRSTTARRRDRGKRRRLADQGVIHLVDTAAGDDRLQTLEVLIDQKRRSFARMGVPDLFARPGHLDFFRALAALPEERRIAHVSRLEVGATTAATNLGLEFRGVYYHVLTSYDDGPLSRFGPGGIHLQDLLRRALENGCTVFDFTIGDEPYKRDWSEITLRLFDLVAASTLRGRAVAAGLGAMRRAKRAIKQSPVLWPLVLRLRTALAGKERGRAPGDPET